MKSNHAIDLSGTVVLLGMLAAASFPATAEEETGGDTAVETIIVTGERLTTIRASGPTKTDIPLIETPQAVSIVDASFIDALNLRTISEALNYSSGVRSQAYGSDTRIEYYQLRGFESQNFFKDGLAQTNGSSFLSWTTPAEGVERIEILKGPSSALYGGSGAGGFVNITTKTPTGGTLLDTEAGIDEYGSVYLSADVGGTLSDTVSVRGVGLVRRGDTQVELAEDNRSYGMGVIRWAPNTGTELLLRASYTADRSNRPTGFIPYEGAVTPLPDNRYIPLDLFVSDPRIDRFDRDQTEIGMEFRQSLGARIRLVSNTRYGEIDLVYAGLYGSFSGNPVVDEETGNVFLNRANSQLDASLSTWTTDNRLEATLSTGTISHTLLAGFDYSQSEMDSVQQTGSAPALNVFSPKYTDTIPDMRTLPATNQTLSQTGFYLQDHMAAGAFHAVVALRHDELKNDTTGSSSYNDEASKTTYRVGAVYVHSSGLAPFVSYATSFAPVLGVEAVTGTAYRPETGKSAEIGLRYVPQDVPISIIASLFDITRDGVLVSDPQPGFPRNRSQAGEQRSRGGEIEVQAEPLRGLTLTGALTAFDLEYREGETSLIGKTPTATPDHTASLFINYAMPPNSALEGLSLGLGIRYSGKSYADSDNTLKVPSATVADVAVRYTAGNFLASLSVSNVFDKEYVAACASAGTCYAGNMRRATLSIGYRY